VHPFFKSWNPYRSTVSEALATCTAAFSEQCPVYSAKPKPTQELSQYNALVEVKYLQEVSKLNSKIQEWQGKKDMMLVNRGKIIDSKIRSLESKAALESAIQLLNDANKEVSSNLIKAHASGDVEQDYLADLMPTDPIQMQLLETVSTEQACEDCLVGLQRHFMDNDMPVAEFAKKHKEVAVQLFTASKLREKIEANLQV